MNPSSIVLRVPLTSKANVGAMNQRTLVRSLLFFHTHFFSPDPCFTRTDREWYSCLNRYDKLFE